MKMFVFLAAIVLSASSWALSAFPDGKWAGDGQYRGQKAEVKGSYTETLTIKDNVLTWELATPGHETEKYAFTVTFQANDFFTFATADHGTGSGYCGTTWCHFSEDDGKVEMTLAFVGDKVYELGSDTEEGQKGSFESTLTQKP